jgi:hypothetical protein
MAEPVVQLSAVGEATEELHGVAKQALEWVRVSEARVAAAEQRAAEAEKRAEAGRVEVKERALTALRKLSEDCGRTREAT